MTIYELAEAISHGTLDKERTDALIATLFSKMAELETRDPEKYEELLRTLDGILGKLEEETTAL